MDDLDHSIHIAEYDWSSFYDDSEECNLLQASLAYPDDEDLSDSEDSGNVNRGQQKTNRRADSNTAKEGCTGSTQLPEQFIQSDATCMKQVEICISCPERIAISRESAHKEIAQGILVETIDSVTNTLQTDPARDCNLGRGEMLSKEGTAQMMSDLKSNKTLDLLSCKQAEMSVSETDPTGRAEKERWFVTVNDNLTRHRRRSTSVKKKLKQKKPCEGENVQNADIKHKSEQSSDVQLSQNKESGDSSEELVIAETAAVMNRDTCEPGSSANTSYDRFLPSPTVLESLLSSELQDDAELSSTGSWDSDSYSSVGESVEESQHLLHDSLTRHLPLQCPSSATYDSRDLTLSYDPTAANSNGYYNTPGTPCSSLSEEMTDKILTSGNDTYSETPPPPLPSGAFQEDQLCPLPALDTSLTLSSAADSPETFAKATGQAQPVYAISAFWDEVEKLTINDILEVRMGKYSKEIEEIVMPNVCRSPPNKSHPTDTFDNAMTDTSDTTDSDYLTQPDESKPDRSVCEFSTSDFEEEYSQFVNASGNPSPELHNKTQQNHFSFLFDDDRSTDSEGRQTPVVLDKSFDCPNFQSLISWPSRLTKRESMYNLQNLKSEEFSTLSFLSLDKNELALSRHQPLVAFSSHTDLQDYRISFPEVVEYFFTEYDDNTKSRFLSVHDPEVILMSTVLHSPLFTFREDPSSSFLHRETEKPVPIFSCSRSTVRDLTLQNGQVILNAGSEEVNKISPMRLISSSFIQSGPHSRYFEAAGVRKSHFWKCFLPLRKICFPDKGSICYSETGTWIFPIQTEEIRMTRQKQAVTLLSDEQVGLRFSQEFRELEEQKRETTWTTKQVGVFSRVKQSDMCLLCIAFASWVLRSSNPEEVDAWKAALLANVSALSAIQYMREYMKRENHPTDDL